MSFGNSFFMLQQEGYVISSCLATGLTALRKANYADKGKYYTAFFQLSIGLERLMKVILILDIMIENQLHVPSGGKIRSFSHDLDSLLKQVGKVVRKHGCTVAIDFQNGSIEDLILRFLTKFAKGSRYANLDALAGEPAIMDPLFEWQKIDESIYQIDISERKRRRIREQAQSSAANLPFSYFIHFDLKNNALSKEEGIELQIAQDEIASYAVWHSMCIIYPLVKIAIHLCNIARSINDSISMQVLEIPYIEEFFPFISTDKSWVLRKKKWVE